MGKSKKGGSTASASSSKKGGAAASTPCSCDHPYQCWCGNRPPRPSKGHKWDPESQSWGGKGHKQKGASGQIASVTTGSKTTQVGKTEIAEWQRLPTKLLEEQLRRITPKYKNISKTASAYQYRLILPDSKDPEKDLLFIPREAVSNEEQAMEEAALLALLFLTPTLPHERKLPEPYKTTWLNAIQALKEQQQQQPKYKSSTNSTTTTAVKGGKPSTAGGGSGGTSKAANTSGAKASSNLLMANSYLSKKDKQQQLSEKRRERNARIRKHENIRLANQNHPVFLSAKLRQQIQALLRGDTDNLFLDDDDDDDENDETKQEDLEDEQPAAQLYVQNRLRQEGFTDRQAKSAYLQMISKPKYKGMDMDDGDDNYWNTLYDECLQWLCIHLDEDQLPEGFDPRGGTLDVIVSSTGPERTKAPTSSVPVEVVNFSTRHGLNLDEAQMIFQEKSKDDTKSAEQILWQCLLKAAANEQGSTFAGNTSNVDDANIDLNKEGLEEELEALEAIFTSECTITKATTATTTTPVDTRKNNATTIVRIAVPMDETNSKATMDLTIHLQDGLYPSIWPERVLVASKEWPAAYGTLVHLEIIKCLSELSLDVPMIFELYGHVQTILQTMVDTPPTATTTSTRSLVSLLQQQQPPPQQEQQPSSGKENSSKQSDKKRKPMSSRPRKLRPRERAAFWSKSPKDTAPARPFPTISKALQHARNSLPAKKARADFLKTLAKAEKNGRVVLVTGDTGCGKTTQIPQFILEENPETAKIVVAQPRRIAATGVAGRVASERGESRPGQDSVGHVVRGDSALSSNTRLVFCTTGILLRQLQCGDALSNISHIIVDEVHERHLDTDVLLGILRESLKEYSNLKVVLMSATLDADRFAAYWGKDTPRMHIPGRTFPVEDFMLEDVLSLTGYIPPKKKKKGNNRYYGGGGGEAGRKLSPWNDSEKSDDGDDDNDNGKGGNNTGQKGGGNNSDRPSIPIDTLVERVNEADLDYDLLAQLVKHLLMHRGPEDDGSILVFLAGAPEINNAIETIKRCTGGLQVLLLPLHGGLQPSEQRLVFDKPRNGLIKVILSTNVAETSITIPDCTVVIDTCREKESSYDPSNRMPLLLEKFASKASLKQRRGRAGRVREGVCYKLISQKTYAKLNDHGTPEIRRCALDQTLLSLLFLGVENGSGNFLTQLMDPPSRDAVNAAIFSLEKLGALESPIVGRDERFLTPLGMHLAGIPAPPPVGKLLVMGSILGCRKAALAMAAGMSTGRSPFLRVDTPFHRKQDQDESSPEEEKNKRILEERSTLFSTVGKSDHAMLAAAFLQWEGASVGGGGRKRVCDNLGLSFVGMKDILQLFKQYDSALNAAGYIASVDADRNLQSWRTIRACVVSALAPSQLVRVQRPAAKYAATVEGAIEQDGKAKELKFFIRSETTDATVATESSRSRLQRPPSERVFIHPSSSNFSIGSYSCPFLVYHTLVRTSKSFLRDATECSAYSLLLFGGKLDVVAEKGIVLVDGWVELAAKARVGSLIGGLRERLDELLAKKIENPSFDIAGSNEMKIIGKLIATDGLGA